MAVKAIDAVLCSGSVDELLDFLGLTDNLSHLFCDDHSSYITIHNSDYTGNIAMETLLI